MPLSSALFLPLVLFVSVVTFEFSLADEKACSIGRHGALTMFNGETTDVELPCKYRLADFTCGDYRVKVTPGSAVDQEDSHRFSPDTVWVKVVNANTSEFVKIRTSVRRLDKFSENRTTNPWQVKEGSKSVVDFADYDESRAAAVLRKDGVFSVKFSSAERSVVVTCSDREFVSEGLPESLCGDETTTDAMNNAMTTLFPGQGNMTDDALVSYIVLNHGNVVQSATCKDLASKFTSCQGKEQAAMECVAIFADPSQAECLATSDTSLADYYYDCLTSVCDGDPSAVDPMNNYISDNCVPWLERSCDSDADCPDSINAECFKGKCLCTLGYYYSNGQDVCVDTCGASKELDRLNGVTGGQSRRRRVVGGTRTGQCNVIPWQVRLTTPGGKMCGGSILDAGHILTAAHCIPYRGTTINITAGDYNTGIIEGNEQTRVVSLTNVTTHPNYYTNRYGAENNDIAVVRLSEPLDMTKPCVMPVCLDKDFVVSGQNCTISGWGAPSESAKEASTLQFANVIAYRGENCTEAFKIRYSSYMSSPDTQLCAGRVAGGVGMCNGDDGGPLVCRDDTINAYVLTGILAYGNGCGMVNFPDIYTDISAFYDWIQDQLKVN